MNLKSLGQAGRTPELPATLELSQGPLQLHQWLRTLPGKRYVAKGTFNGNTVLAKLWIGPRGATKLKEEQRGTALLQNKELATPSIIASGIESDGAWQLNQWLDQAQTLQQVLGLETGDIELDSPPPLEPLSAVAKLLSSMHSCGAVQDDIHPGNFLWAEQQWWIVDAADVRPINTERDAFENLGTFLAQLPENWQDSVLSSYGLKPHTEQANTALVQSQQWRSHRAQDLANKSLRDCTLFQVNQDFRSFESQWRENPLDLSQLDEKLNTGKMLKDGGSATVGLIEYAGRKLVLKRYNLKNWRHWLKRFWRPTRAWHSWWAGHRLRVLGISTPKPVALREERWGYCRGRGYLLTEVAPGQDILATCQDEASTRKVALQIRRILEIFVRDKISHGDFKGTNLMWDGHLHLIDLDAVQWHKDHDSWQRAFNKDIERLLRNWPQGSMQHRLMSELVKDSIKY
ncbi:MAG: lipopolysaccharide kinase InaA family protein [Pseudomonadota bacterium]|nr:lipopolysaccharide kinase InaA family protein [Pseudomonadota bacterium]